jgi:hypothetical protein
MVWMEKRLSYIMWEKKVKNPVGKRKPSAFNKILKTIANNTVHLFTYKFKNRS